MFYESIRRPRSHESISVVRSSARNPYKNDENYGYDLISYLKIEKLNNRLSDSFRVRNKFSLINFNNLSVTHRVLNII